MFYPDYISRRPDISFQAAGTISHGFVLLRSPTETFRTSHVQSKIIHMKVNTTDIPNKGVCQLPQFVFHILHHLFSLFPVPEGGQKSGHDNVPMAVLSVGEQRLHNKPNVVLVLRPHLRDDLVIVPRLEYRQV